MASKDRNKRCSVGVVDTATTPNRKRHCIETSSSSLSSILLTPSPSPSARDYNANHPKATFVIDQPREAEIPVAVGNKLLIQQQENHPVQSKLLTVSKSCNVNNTEKDDSKFQGSTSPLNTQSKGNLCRSSVDTNDQNIINDNHNSKKSQLSPQLPPQSDDEEFDAIGSVGDESDESSLLSSWSEESNEDQELLDSDRKGIERLKKKLELRKERLKRLSVGRPLAYITLLETNEELTCRFKIAKYKKNHPNEDCVKNKDDDREDHEEDTSSLTSSVHLLSNKKTWQMLFGIIQFEAYHTLPGFYTIVIICFGSTAFYGFIDIILKIVYHTFVKTFMSQDVFNILLTIVGLCLLRINGLVFEYTSLVKTYSLLRIEMDNRLKLGSSDARLWKRIQKSPAVNSSCNMFGFYLVCIGLNHFYYKYNYIYMQRFELYWEGIWSTAVTQINNEMQRETQRQAEGTCIIGSPAFSTIAAVSPRCERATEIVSHPIHKWLVSGWCNDLLFEYRDVQLVYHGFWFLISIFLCLKVGQNMMTFCD